MRRFHRWLGLGSVVVVLLATITGLLWAYAPYLYWEDGYMERKHPVAPFSFEEIKLTHQDAIRIARESIGAETVVSAVNLGSDAGMPLYKVAGKQNGKERIVLIDALAGNVISPLTPEFATRFAAQYVHGTPAVEAVTLLDTFKHRKGKAYDSVYLVRFHQEKSPEILLSAHSGEIIEDQDDVRSFHFWVMRLHQLNFFGFKKTLTIIPGAALLMLTISGIVISRRRKSRGGPAGKTARVQREKSLVG